MSDFAIIDSCDIESTLTFRKFFRYFISFDDFADFLLIQFDLDRFKKYVNQMKKAKNDWNWNCKWRTYIDAKNANSSFSIMTKLCWKIRSINMIKRSIFLAKIRFDEYMFLSWFITCFFFWSINTFFRRRVICRQIIVANSLKIHRCSRFTKEYDHCNKLIVLYWCDF